MFHVEHTTTKTMKITDTKQLANFDQFNFNSVLNGRARHKTQGWIKVTLSDHVLNTLCYDIAALLWSQQAKVRQYGHAMWYLAGKGISYSIFERVNYDVNRERWEYIAGQDYPAEVEFIKRLIRKHLAE